MPSLPPIGLVLDLLLQVLLPSLTASALVLTLFALPGKSGWAAAGAALALVAGIAAGNWFRDALPWRPEQAAWQWLPAAAAAALVGGLLARVPYVPVAAGWLLRAAAAGMATWLLVPPATRAETWWLAPAFFAVVLAEWAILELSAGKMPSGVLPAGLALVFFGGGMVLIHAHTARLADIGFLTAAALIGIALVAWWKRADSAAAMPGAAVLLPGLLLSGHLETFSDVPAVCFALAALAPLALAPALLPPLSRWTERRRQLLQLGLLLVPVLVALVLAMRAAPLDFE